MKSKSILRFSTITLLLGTACGAPLLTDNFNSPSYGASTFNSYLAADQAGSLATISYTTSAPGGDWSTQHSNGDAILIANAGGNNWVSLNHDFSVEANLINKPLVIQFDARTTDGQPWAWLGFGIGPAQGTDFYSQPYGINFAQSAGAHTYKFVISDTAGTGSAFNGVTNGAKVEMFIDGVSQGTTTKTLSAGDGYITFKQDQWDGWSIGHVDNLSIEMDTTFPAGETLTWTGATDANWNETTPNWSNVNAFTKWYSNTSNTNNVVFDATGAAQPNVNFALTRPLTAGSISFDSSGYNLGGTVTLGNSQNFVTNADATVSATLQGSANITKSGLSTLSLTGTSSFSGVTILEDGVLNASSFSDYGVNSSLGNRAADSAEVGLLFQGGTLQYTGATAQSTNRSIRLGLEGGTIDASGSAPAATLSFTASSSTNFFLDSGSRTLTLTGSNTGDNTFAMAIGQAGGTTSVVKDGAGKWILSGANTYTGSTTVNGGTLSLSSAFLDNQSTVSIASGAKVHLNFTGNDIIGNLEINGSGPLPAGIYNSSHATYGSYFTGTGSLLVLNGSNGIWTSLVDGIWDEPANWQSNTIAAGFDQSATFNQATGVTITLNANKTIGSLVFDTSDYTLAGPGTLTLDASANPAISVGDGRIATVSANVAGIYGLEKTGDGKLVFTGAKTYTGLTTISGGTLELSGAMAGNAQIHGSVLVNPGATLAFTNGDGTGIGFFNSPASSFTVDGGTINATSGSHLGFGPFMTMTLDNGGSLQGSWQWNGDGLLAFSCYGNSTNTISGTITLRADNGANHSFYVDDGESSTDLQINAVLADQWPEVGWTTPSGLTKNGPGKMVLAGSNSYDGNTVVNDGALEITATSRLHFRPTANGTTNSVSGSATATLSFTGTVDLDLGAAVATGGNLWNLFNLASFSGPSPVLTPSAVTSTLGSFTEVSTGVWELPVTGAKWVFTEADGNLAYTVTASDFDSWSSSFGLTGGASGDDDADGLTNFEEYAFGLIPNSGSSVNPITAPLNNTTGKFSYTRRKQSLGTNLIYSVWFSTDLATWTKDTGATEGTPVPSGDNETVEVTLSTAPGNPLPAKLFIQVRAE